MKNSLLIWFSILFLSCQQDIPNQMVYGYFDSHQFVEKEIGHILKNVSKVEKEIWLNGQKEVQTIAQIDSAFLFNEFRFIIDVNINKTALYGQYEIDSSAFDERLNLDDSYSYIEYKLKDANNKKVKTKSLLTVHSIPKDEFVACLFLVESQNFMNAYQKRIYYQRGNRLEINAWEKTIFQDTLFYQSNLRID